MRNLAILLIGVAVVTLVVILFRKYLPPIETGPPQPIDRDAQVVSALQQAGDPLTASRRVDFYLYLAPPVTATVAARLEAEGYATEIRPGPDGQTELCLAWKTLVPTLETIQPISARLAALCAEFHGEYDGWETMVIRG